MSKIGAECAFRFFATSCQWVLTLLATFLHWLVIFLAWAVLGPLAEAMAAEEARAILVTQWMF